MKKFTLLFALTFIIFATVSSQSCLPEGIIFLQQAEVDNFQINHPGCTEIEGDVTFNGSGINNLDSLSVLSAIGGNLWFLGWNELDDLTGLDNVTSVGGDLEIDDNEALTSLTGLGNLTSTGGNFQISGNDILTSFPGVEN